MKTTVYIGICALLLTSCDTSEKQFDATGNFSATEYVISSQAAGELVQFSVQEGNQLAKGVRVAVIDSTQIYLKKRQVEAQMEALKSRKPNKEVQLAALKEQLETAKTEKQRLEKLVSGNAATTKQLDDVKAQIEVLKKQLAALNSNLSLQISSLDYELEAMKAQLAQLEDQLKKCSVMNPVQGTVLATYAEAFEITSPGRPLYKIADLSQMELKAYVSGNQLMQLKLGQQVTVRTDNGDGAYVKTQGELMWISDKAEFTPKAIQTKDERANRVYAIKVRVKNDGRYKIGMYGEVVF
jgi:HlyD family secretion protein